MQICKGPIPLSSFVYLIKADRCGTRGLCFLIRDPTFSDTSQIQRQNQATCSSPSNTVHIYYYSIQISYKWEHDFAELFKGIICTLI